MYQNNIWKYKCSKREILFFAAYFLLIVYRLLKSMTIGLNDNGITYLIIMAMLVGRIFMLKVKTNSSFFAVCLLSPLIAVCVFNTWDPIIPVVLLMLLASKDIDLKQIVRASYTFVWPLIILGVLFAVVGITEDVTSLRTMNGGVVVCHGAGFNHSSALPTYYCYLFLGYLFLKNGKVRIYQLLGWAAGGFIIFHFCGERLRFGVLLIACIMAIESNYLNVISLKVKKVIGACIFPTLCIVSNCLGYFYNPFNSFLYRLNILLTNRLYLEKYTFNHYGIPLFGQSLKMGEEAILVNGNLEYFYIDSGYVYIFAVYGIIIGLLLLALYTVGAYKSTGSENKALFVWFICMAIDALVGNQMVSIWICPLLFVPFCSLEKNISGENWINCNGETTSLECYAGRM